MHGRVTADHWATLSSISHRLRQLAAEALIRGLRNDPGRIDLFGTYRSA